MEEFSEQGLLQRLEEHAKHFDKMLEFISVDVYYPPEVSEEDWANRFTKNKDNKAPKLAIKQATKKAKKARLNPANYKSVPDIQKEVLEEKMEATKEKAAAGGVKRKRVDSDSELSPEPEPQNPLEVLGLTEPRPAVTPKPSRADLKELRDRLQERITQLRAKRKAVNKESDTQPIPPPKKKQKKEKDKKKKKKKEKNKKVATKGSNEEEKGTKIQTNGGVEGKGSNKRKRSESNPDQPPETSSDHKTEEPEKKKVKKQKTEAKVKADVRYGAIEFNKGTPLPESLAKKKGLNKKKLLHKLEREKEKEPKNGSNVSQKKAWDKLIAKAKGEKVKDDVSLVKKSLKKEEQKKKKSQKEWKERDKETKNRQ